MEVVQVMLRAEAAMLYLMAVCKWRDSSNGLLVSSLYRLPMVMFLLINKAHRM